MDYSHNFHQNCLIKELKNANYCPVCRNPVTTEMFINNNVKDYHKAGYGGVIVAESMIES